MCTVRLRTSLVIRFDEVVVSADRDGRVLGAHRSEPVSHPSARTHATLGDRASAHVTATPAPVTPATTMPRII